VALYLGLTFAPRPTRVLTNILAVAGIAELAYVGVEQLEWSGRAARRASARAN
jgi:threonine/homoserine/homoserine lactone efflux protein